MTIKTDFIHILEVSPETSPASERVGGLSSLNTTGDVRLLDLLNLGQAAERSTAGAAHEIVAIIRAAALARALSVSTTTIWRWRKRGDFPVPYRLGDNSIGWDEAEIRQWLQARRTVSVVAPVADGNGTESSPTSKHHEPAQGHRRRGDGARGVTR